MDIRRYLIDKNKNLKKGESRKDKKLKDIILPLISIMISLLTAGLVFFIGIKNNETLLEISNSTNKNAIDLKKYEVDSPDKRKVVIDLSREIKKVKKETIQFCYLTDNSWDRKYSYKENIVLDSLAKIIKNCLSNIDEQTLKLNPFLVKDDRDSLERITNTFIQNTEKYLNPQGRFQGINKYHAYNIWVFQEYSEFISYIKEKLLN